MQIKATTSSFNIPNALSFLRLGLALWLPFLWFSDSVGIIFFGGIIFTIGAITDFLDGIIARKYNIITHLGIFIDPVADKILTLGAFATLSLVGMFPFWILIPVFIREIGITILRIQFRRQGVNVAAVKSGKLKTTIQIVAIYVIFFVYFFRQAFVLPPALDAFFTALIVIMLIATVWQTLYSGYEFLRNNRSLL